MVIKLNYWIYNLYYAINMFDFQKNHYLIFIFFLEFVRETFTDGSIYEGEKLHGLKHGKGKFYYANGGSYGIYMSFIIYQKYK